MQGLLKVSAHISFIYLTSNLPSFSILFCYIGPVYDYLAGPVIRVTGADVPMPYAKSLEANALPIAKDIVDSVRKLVQL